MKTYHKIFRKNKGSSPIVFFILVGILGFIVIVGGLLLLGVTTLSRKDNTELLNQVNNYIKSRNEIVSFAEKIKSQSANLTNREINELTREYLKKWEELDKQKLPAELKDINKECHRISINDAKTLMELSNLDLEVNKNNQNANKIQLEKAEKLLQDLENSQAKKVCDESDKKMKEYLAKKGIKFDIK